MSMNVPMTMLAANTSALTQEVLTGVNATVDTTSRLMGRAVKPHHQVHKYFRLHRRRKTSGVGGGGALDICEYANLRSYVNSTTALSMDQK